jgi:hypothetical protein
MFNYKKIANPAMPPAGRYFNWGNQVSIEVDHDAFAIISYGPDQKYDAAEWFDYAPVDTEYIRIYDPSNGTISPGDILRLGGSSFHQASP